MRGLVLLFTLHFGREPVGADPWFSSDKAKHFFMSAFIQSASFSALRFTGASRTGALVGATAVSLSIGAGKELYDKKFGGDPSLKDLTWDGAGIAAASLLLRHTQP
jgi:putative lipoprotein